MSIQNAEIAQVFERVADALALEGANPFRVRAYRKAALTIHSLPRPLFEMLREGQDLSKLPAIGTEIAKKIAELVTSGHLHFLEELEARTPAGLTRLLDVPGLGPKRVRALHAALGVESRDELLAAAREGRVREVAGFGVRSEKALLTELEARTSEAARILWADARPLAEQLVAWLERLEGVSRVVVAGSFRRKKETVGDLDLLVTCRRGTDVSAHLVAYEDVERVLVQGPTKTSLRLRSGLQVDLRVVSPASYGAALFYFTGSRAHNIALRKLALEREYKLNEYGVFRGSRRIAGRSEREVYEAVGLPYIEPELRELRGELEAAREGRLPTLLEYDDIRGDLHAHTTASDGSASVEEMAAAARALGREYLAISDHTRAARIAHGLDAKRMREHLDHVRRVDAELQDLRLLCSAEVDILPDGKLDLPADLLDELDVVVGAVHSAFHLSREKQTERILRAMDDPHLQILAHPSGRLLLEREPYALDLERIIEGAAERGCALELNAQPRRLDLSDVSCKAAKQAGVRIAVSTDAHGTAQLENMRLGVGYARRGWLEKDDVLNTRPWPELEPLLRRS